MEKLVMGHRGNYVLRQDGQTLIYYTQFGANAVAATLLHGPDETIEVIRSHSTTDHFQDSVWCEGAILCDIDAKHMRFFGNDVPNTVRERRPLVAELLIR